MAFALSAPALSAGYRLAAFDTIGSTNAEARARVLAGESGPLWIAARKQTAGRGRRSREWETAEGNLAATLMLTTRAGLSAAAMLGFVAGLAVTEALQRCAPSLTGRLRFKWPNDVLVEGAKLCGILLESEPREEELAVMIGIGINVVSAPSHLPYPAISLAALGAKISAEQLFTALSESWLGYFRLWDEGRGTAAILMQWRAQAAGLGSPIAIELGDKRLEGIFDNLDEHGRLILRDADNALITIAAGDVHFGPAATMPRREAR